MANIARLREFVQGMTRLVERHGGDEARMLAEGEKLLQPLIANDDWLPEQFAVPSDESYRQYLLYCDPQERFSVVSFVWQPGQKTPVHNHTVWGLVGVMRGEELCEEFSAEIKLVNTHKSKQGEIDRVSPSIGDIHTVSNGGSKTAVSIHVYGGNIGAIRRNVFDPATGTPKEFVSGYSNSTLPNLWDRGA